MKRNKKINLIIASSFIFLLFSCAIRVTSYYDSYSDDLIMSFSRDISSLIELLEDDVENGADYCNIKNYQDYYVRLNSTLFVLELRNVKRNRNNITIDSISALTTTFNNFEKRHSDLSKTNDCISQEELQKSKAEFRKILAKLTDLELYKKFKPGNQR